MQQTLQLGQVQPSTLSALEGIVKNAKAAAIRWWQARNEWFSAMSGEQVTNKHVVLAHLYLVALVAVLVLMSRWEGGAL